MTEETSKNKTLSLEELQTDNSSPFDVNGSYTGKCYFNSDSAPVQDADDL